MSSREKVIERVRALRAVANDAGASEEEAASFAAKAAKLVEEHMIEEAELQVEKSPFDYYKFKFGYTLSNNVEFMINTICASFGVALLVPKNKHSGNLYMYGRKLNCDAAVEVVDGICEQIRRLTNSAGIADGIACGVSLKIYQRMEMVKKEAENPDNLPMVVEIEEINAGLRGDGVAQAEAIGPEMKTRDQHIGMMMSDYIELDKKLS